MRFISNLLTFQDQARIAGTRQQERKRGRTYKTVKFVRFPRLSGMVPVSLFCQRYLQQWEHEQR